MLLECKCGHRTDEGSLAIRVCCKGCGLQPKDDSSAAWDEFMEAFDFVDEVE
jgi:hypothetical protein